MGVPSWPAERGSLDGPKARTRPDRTGRARRTNYHTIKPVLALPYHGHVLLRRAYEGPAPDSRRRRAIARRTRLLMRSGTLRRRMQRLALGLRLGNLHIRSRRMKVKLRMLGRRREALMQDIARLQTAVTEPTADTGVAVSHAPDAPIWIHAPWRAGSTYVWSKFRAQDRYLAFYEPFHEVLEGLTRDDIARSTSASWPSGHPLLQAPYYQEYSGLLNPGGGVRGFQFTFPYAHYLANEAPLREQQAYLRALVEYAQAQGRRPVFGFCRSLGRVPWFKRYMPGVHIALTRDGLGLWRSAIDRQARYGDTYFLTRPFMILFAGRHDAWITAYLADLGLANLAYHSDMGRATRAAERLVAADPDLTARAFAAVFALAITIAQRHCDLTIPVETLSTLAGRRALNATLIGRFNIAIDWQDCRIPVYAARPEDSAFLGYWERALIHAEVCHEAWLQEAGARDPRTPAAAPVPVSRGQVARRILTEPG